MYAPGKIKKPPDFAQLMQTKQHLVGIVWKGILWRWSQCFQCREWFWRNSTGRRLEMPRKQGVYCSKGCQKIGYRVLNNARQKRWKLRQKAGLVKPAFADTRTNNP